MELDAETLDYYGLINAHDEGNLDDHEFGQLLLEHGWWDRYIDDFLGMVSSDMPFFEKAASKA